MLKAMCVICICVVTFPAFGQAASKYQVGTITEVKTHQSAGDGTSEHVSYDVSVKVGDTIYQVLYTPPLGMSTMKYAAGRDVLVLVGKNTIRYNDLLGQSFEVPIVSRKSATDAKQSKQESAPTCHLPECSLVESKVVSALTLWRELAFGTLDA